MATVHSIPVSPELHLRIEQLAHSLGKSVSEVVHDAVDALCEEQSVERFPELTNDVLIEKARRYRPPQEWYACAGGERLLTIPAFACSSSIPAPPNATSANAAISNRAKRSA